MENIEKYNEAFISSLEITTEQLENVSTQNCERWDSIGHMSLIAVLEEAFEIEFDPEDMTAITSYNNGKEIIKKYGVEL